MRKTSARDVLIVVAAGIEREVFVDAMREIQRRLHERPSWLE
jgi:hypothetical protein